MKKNNNKLIGLVIILIVIFMGMVYWYVSPEKENNNTDGSILQAPVIQQTITKTITGSGEVASKAVEKVELNTYRYLREVLVTEGQVVKEGEPLLKYTNGYYLYAPYDCVVRTINVGEVGDICRSSHYIGISQITNLTVALNIDESDLKNIDIGQEVSVKLNAFDNKIYTGTITKINGIGNYSNSGSSFEITVSFENDGEANVGMSAYCVITVDKAENVLAVPLTAVQRRGAMNYVIVVLDDGTTEERIVAIGLSNSVYVEIKSGLELGEYVQYTDSSSSSNSRGSTRSGVTMGMPVVTNM